MSGPGTLRTGSLVTAAKVTVASSPTPTPSPTPTAQQAKPSPPAAAVASSTDPLWDHNASTWLIDMAVLLLLALGFAFLTWWRLIKMGPVKRR